MESPDERGIASLFAKLGLPSDALGEFCQHLQHTAIDDVTTIPAFLRRMLAETMRDTWFCVPNSPQMVLTRRGSRPGGPLADLCFSFALKKILEAAYKDLEQCHPPLFFWSGICDPWPVQNPKEPLGLVAPIWADDIAVALAANTAADLIAYTTTVAARLFDALALAGMRANLKCGKSELVLDVRGKQATQIKRDLMRQDMSIALPTKIEHERLHVVGIYKHLGTWIATGGNMVYDIRTKIGIAHATLTKYKAPIFANRAMNLKKKVQLFRSLILTPIIFSSAAWHHLAKVALRTFVNGIFGLYKRVAALHLGRDALHFPHLKLCSALGLETPQVILHVARLRYVQQIIRFGQPQLWGLLQQTPLWWNSLADAFQWLQTRTPHLPDVGHPIQDWYTFEGTLKRPGNAWKRMIKRAVHFEVRYLTLQHRWNEWHSAIVLRLKENGLLPDPVKVTSITDHFCLSCRQVFGTAAAWSVHSFRKHGRVTPARRYANGTQCAGCLKHYSSYVALINHLKYSSRCLDQIRGLGPIEHCTPGLNSRHELRERKPLHLPPIQAEGPHLPRGRQGNAQELSDEAQRLLEGWSHAFNTLGPAAPETVTLTLKEATMSTTLHANEILNLFDVWIADQLELEQVSLDLLLVAHMFRCRFSVVWLLPERQDGIKPIEADWRDMPQHWHDTIERITRPAPSLAYKPVCLAHLFSGHRRYGDIQFFAEKCDGILQDARILSVDIVFDITYGDLARGETVELFCRAIQQGYLHAVIAGPPCETWSVAREANEEGPRKLRDAQHLSGLDALTSRELAQIEVGNTLLGASLRLLTEAALSNAFFLLEHPDIAEYRPNSASIWKIPLVELLARFDNVKQIRVNQGLYGADSPKPTRFMVVNCIEEAQSFFAQFQTRIFLPLGRSIGRDKSGHWRTAKLKAYPPPLCKAIVALAEISLRRLLWSEAEKAPAWFHESLDALCQSFDFDAEMGPDFAGRLQ